MTDTGKLAREICDKIRLNPKFITDHNLKVTIEDYEFAVWIEPMVASCLRQVILEERFACAEICEKSVIRHYGNDDWNECTKDPLQLANEIRNRTRNQEGA